MSYLVCVDSGFVGADGGTTCNPSEAIRFEGENGYRLALDESDRWANSEVEVCDD